MFSVHVDTSRAWHGVQNQTLLTVLGLRALGHRTWLAANPEGELKRHAEEGLELLPIAPRSEMDFASGWRLSRALRQLRPDILHAHDPHAVAMASMAVSMAYPPPCPPLVASRRVAFRIKRNAFSLWKYHQVNLFLCASEVVRQHLIADGIPARLTTTVHDGIDLRHVDASPPVDLHAELWLPHGAPIVGTVGALVPHKGHRHFVAAAARVLRKVPDARFLIVGEGDERPALEAQIRQLKLEKHVILAGWRPDVLSVHKAFDLFVLSSVTEGLGTALLDAMACRRAVVATRTGGVDEAVDEDRTGLLVEPHDEPALARAIITLLGDEPARRRMGEAGRARVEEKFSVERMVADTLDAYERVTKMGTDPNYSFQGA
ncbi:MAG TPA: glycosyltransferase [Vicinamibacterales bacterium]|nr:glycosyltransferase [Vicinamibacterales bacterium]